MNRATRETEQDTPRTDDQSSWALQLFSKSVLKQRKLKEISAVLGDCSSKRCLDLGSDNGVISFLLRSRGGCWASADLSPETVNSIRSLVGTDVHLVAGGELPFADEEFDAIAVVDMLEHVPDDRRLMEELRRVLKPGGLLVLNVPNLKTGSPLRLIRHLIGQTDEAHGHLRPGYSESDLQELCGQHLVLERTHTYSRFFSELIDTMIVFGYGLLAGASSKEPQKVSKGLVVTEEGLKKFHKKFRMYSAIYPVVKSVSKLDLLIPFVPGFMRLAVCRKRS